MTAAQLLGNDTAPNTGATLGVNCVSGAYQRHRGPQRQRHRHLHPHHRLQRGDVLRLQRQRITNGYTSPNFATVSLTVAAAANQVPTAVNQGPFTVTNNTPLTLTAAQLLSNDTTPNTGATLSVNSVSAATNGTAVLNANGTVTFTPTTGYSGAASFGYNVKDTTGAISNTATVSLTVTAPVTVNQAPTAVNDGPFTVTKNTPLTLTAAQLVGNDIAPNTGDTLGVSWVGGAYNGTAVLNANGTVTFTPTTGYTGATSFIYNVKDIINGYTSPNFATVSLTVAAAANQVPTAVNQGPFTVTNNTPLTLTAAQLLSNDTTPNTGATLSVNSVSAATNGTAVLNANGTVTFTPTTGYSGAASFGYNVKDTTGAVSNTATVSLTVTAARRPPRRSTPRTPRSVSPIRTSMARPPHKSIRLNDMKAMGVNEVRILIPWAGIEPTQGADYYATTDYMVNACGGLGGHRGYRPAAPGLRQVRRPIRCGRMAVRQLPGGPRAAAARPQRPGRRRRDHP